MVFYNNRVSIADVGGKEIYLFRSIKEELILNYYSDEGEMVESILADDASDEFDIFINDDDSIYLIYQDTKHNLNLVIIKGEDKTTHKLTADDFPKAFEVNIIKHEDYISMIFLYPIYNAHNVFQIEHNMLKEDQWHNFLVDQVRISQVLNPIKVLSRDRSIFLAYYYENQICLKIFNTIDEEWGESIVLTDNREKLYLDMIFEEEYFYLVYSEAVDGNYIIKFKIFSYEYSFMEEYEADISRKSNSSNPTIIKNGDLLWIVWNESSRVYSRYSSDNGITWSEIKSWDESIKQNIVRYKYTSNHINNRIIDNTFGTIYPDIKFIGFH